ncbi:hypothetical protein H4Q26_013891 [Puccinia striiformis f. sp. tritici PST-130]|nr:hypothetical protein H4Q26_013891 [Puccinia striiformis f. sp. tritici PST-130]
MTLMKAITIATVLHINQLQIMIIQVVGLLPDFPTEVNAGAVCPLKGHILLKNLLQHKTFPVNHRFDILIQIEIITHINIPTQIIIGTCQILSFIPNIIHAPPPEFMIEEISAQLLQMNVDKIIQDANHDHPHHPDALVMIIDPHIVLFTPEKMHKTISDT